MAGYTPLFSSLTTGTLCGRWPDIGLWPIILSLSDRHGIVDVTPAYIAGITGLPIAEVIPCMARFCEPDPYSRSPAEAGARLVLIDAHREWGWRIVNHERYREKARKTAYDAERTASGRDRERKAESRAVPTCPAPSRVLPLSDSDSDSDSDKDLNPKNPDRAAEPPGAEPPEFAVIRKEYPKRAGDQRWHDALRAFNARVREGTTPQAILEGVRRYAAFVRTTGKERTEHVQQAATFLGKNRGFELPWSLPQKPETAGERLMRTLNGDNSTVIEHDAEFLRLAGH